MLHSWKNARLAGSSGLGGIVDQAHRHQVQGLCADDAGNVWIAVTELREIKKVAPDETVSVVARTAAPWSPTGVLAAPGGHLWLLEYGPGNDARVRHVGPDGSQEE